MAVLPTGIGPVTGYNIERSLRFNSADSAYLNRTPGSASNRKTWTWSAWVKRSAITANSPLFAVSQDSSNFTIVRFGPGTTDKLEIYTIRSSTDYSEETNALFRDVSAWYHIVFSVDTTQATAANRIRIYVNGVQQTTTQFYGQIPQNEDTFVNTTNAHNIGRNTDSTTQHFNGYLTEINFIDGQALTPSSFGETDAATGVWKPKAYTGTYGTNGFYLKFADNSGTTSTTLGKDSSGNGNNWTPNNFSVTAGAGNDSLVDSPTAYGTDTGVGGEVRGNYCTWNSAAQSTVANGTVTRSNGNLESTDGGTTYSLASFGTMSVSSGKWYWEVTLTTAGGSAANMGIVDTSKKLIAGTAADAHFGFTYGQNGNKTDGRTYGGSVFSTNGVTAYGASYVANDVIGVALNLDVGEVTFYKNGVSQGVAFTGISGQFAPAVGDAQNATSYTWTLNAGQRAFAYTAPSGFKALCTQNLPTPTIADGGEYFNTVLWTGNGASSRSITGVGFQPDFVWIKSRSAVTSHALFDQIRGAQKWLGSNSTSAEQTYAGTLDAFGSDGFTVGSDAWTNGGSTTYAAWNWNAGGSNATNTSGTITSTVSANTTSGFSIVTYTGTGANATVGHGLGVAPSLIIVKARTQSAARNWKVYSSVLGAGQTINFNETAAAGADTTIWNNTSPTSTVFSVGASNSVNENTYTYVAYCFANVEGYSRAFSYTGNGSSDGPFVFLGFRPRFVMIKRTDSTANWEIWDTTRSVYNQTYNALYPNLSNAEDVGNAIDINSNGFKLRDTGGSTNSTSSATYIGFAIAENPFKYSLAR
jgi:hypothetical protein